jgi:hypothetical protein
MFRISVAGILWLIVLAALNSAVLRFFEYFAREPEPILLLVGLMPLFDAFIISLCVAATRSFRFELRRRDHRRGFSGAFALTTAAMLVGSSFLCIVATHPILELLQLFLDPVIAWFKVIAEREPTESVVGVTLCLVMSGPMLVIAAILSFIMSRYELVISRRE